jgi:hypothetical protein
VNLDGTSFVKEVKGLESFQPKPGNSRWSRKRWHGGVYEFVLEQVIESASPRADPTIA